jgi:adenylate cyclase
LEFTVVGDHVNTAKRLCDRATAGKIVIGSETFEAVKEYVEATPIGTVVLRGKQKPVHAYELVSLRQSFPRS